MTITQQMDAKRAEIARIRKDMGGLNPATSTYRKLENELRQHENHLATLTAVRDGDADEKGYDD